ncbi:hypothetical protein [Pedobacter mucosus]|uniref:hypothetical protein n=1 Tax=Pedobacter mucosus TaxID=2895286 RepID=UPI001EE4137A|nr:hypothetical protein [Pedobacter mucosus]UKT66106.1 hypothetical protein LOK61_09995 [Pedobacter mucosus]
MRSIVGILLGLSISLFACNSVEHKNINTDSTTKKISVGESKLTIGPKFLIIPGVSIGQIKLGEDTQEIGNKLGTPDAGDAAMGKAWSIWYSEDPNTTRRNELSIYSSYKDSSATSKDVKQIRITSGQFKTLDGFGTGRKLKDAQAKFPDLDQISTYLNEKKDTVLIYDSKSQGIGFEFLSGKSISLTVHPKNVSVNATYLAIHPDWKLVN